VYTPSVLQKTTNLREDDSPINWLVLLHVSSTHQLSAGIAQSCHSGEVAGARAKVPGKTLIKGCLDFLNEGGSNLAVRADQK
jgi:hypothetical protein